ncbi:MAG: sigma-54 dependent transcriptional regulator [Candidatus Manganitrophus sp. SB1]|nr:sigma-54 dependent transcriptional regulator [Candidatus Manganitrophus morganii]
MTKTILQIDLRDNCAHPDPCSNLKQIITDHLPGERVQLIGASALPSAEALSIQAPHLILLQSSSEEIAAEAVFSFRRLGYFVPVLWLSCQGPLINLAPLNQVLQVADDFLFCPFQPGDLIARIQKWLQLEDRSAAERLKIDLGMGSLIGESAPFIKVLRQISLLARCDATVLLSGETGTGKELAARAIHYLSARAGGPFIPVNCSALPETLLENELFGHTKGAYTDASLPQRGLIAEAESGTLLLDEIDGLSLTAQAKILRFLQEGEYRPLGGRQALQADVRIVAATNANLIEKVKAGTFREDLYFRLYILSLSLPPLRERPEDIPLLAKYFLKKYCRRFRSDYKILSPAALMKLSSYAWPGNVRELEAVIQRAIVHSPVSLIQAEEIDLPTAVQMPSKRDPPFQALKRRTIDTFEKSYLCQLLMTHRGNISRAAKEAGKDRRAFRRLMEKHGLVRQHFINAGQGDAQVI